MFFTRTVFNAQRARRMSNAISARCISSVTSALSGAVLLFAIHQVGICAPINYGSHTGTTVDYIDVSEDTTSGDALPLFGAPIFSADSVDFNPVGFDATASGAAGSDTTGSNLTFMVQSHAGNAIKNINFSEAGQATLTGAGNDATFAQVTAAGTVTISHVDGAAITPITRPIALTFTPSGGDYGLATDGGGLPIFHTQWSGSLAVDIAQILTQESVPFTLGASKINIDLTNTLSARSQDGTTSLISKQDFGGISISVNQPGGGGGPDIPEPASFVLASLAVIGVLGGGRRNR